MKDVNFLDVSFVEINKSSRLKIKDSLDRIKLTTTAA